MKNVLKAAAAFTLLGSVALADGHAPKVTATDQDMSDGIVSASHVMTDETGWLVVHRTDGSKPGPVVGHAPLRHGKNADVAAILTEPVKPGEKLMLMIHSEAGGNKTGIFEYTLGAKEDGPIKPGGKLVMTIVTAQ